MQHLLAPLLLVLAVAVGRADAETGPVAHRESLATIAAAIKGLRTGVDRLAPATASPERVYVMVSGLDPERRAALEATGLVIEIPVAGAPAPRWRDGELVQGFATPAAQRDLAALPFVFRVVPPGLPWRNVGAVVSAGATIHSGAAAQDVLGHDGEGVLVGVISDGMDDHAASIASGDLPADVAPAEIAGLRPGDGTEGTAVLEIVHDLAPGARLLFAGPRTSAEMVLAIDGLAAAGADVIVDDLVFTDEPKFEDGPIALAARRFATGGGIYVTAGGNFALSHYLAPYRRGRGANFGSIDYLAVHLFAEGDAGDTLRIPSGADVLAVLQWNDPFGRAVADFDLVLAQGNTVLASSITEQNGAGDPIETLHFVNRSGSPLRAYLAIAEFGGVPDPARVQLNLLVFSRFLVAQEYTVRRESVFGHAAVEEVLSVAAADAARSDVVEAFSSRGPATVFFPTLSVRAVPRLTAVDGVETAVGRRGSFANPFFGTSAAAPHAAGCAALLLSAGLPTSTAVSAMLATARDLLPAGVDTAAGAGLLDCAAAARRASGQATAPVVDTLAAGFDGTVGVTVHATGADPDGDLRTATLRLLDRHGEEILRQSVEAGPGPTFGVSAVVREAILAGARQAAVSVRDATGLESPEITTTFGCPADGSLGDTFCTIGDLLERLTSTPLRQPRRLERPARAAAAALTQAGEASHRRARARRAIRTALARLGRLGARARRASLDPLFQQTVAAESQALRTQLRTLRSP